MDRIIRTFALLAIMKSCWIQIVLGKCITQNGKTTSFPDGTVKTAYEMSCENFLDNVSGLGTSFYKSTYKHMLPNKTTVGSFGGLLNGIMILEIVNTRLSDLYPDCLEGYKNLKEIHLSHNKIERIQNNVFSDKKYLEFLDLSFNSIAHIEEHALTGDVGLKFLYLNDNQISYLNTSLFNDLKSLEALFLSNNPIKRVSTIASEGLLNLKHVYLNKLNLDIINYILIIPKLGSQISELYISQNNITKINTITFVSLSELRILDLSNNLIDSIEDDSFTNNKNLKQLYLNNNDIKKLPDSLLSPLKSLKHLDLSNNPVIHIGEHIIEKMLQLEVLKIVNLALTEDNTKFLRNMKQIRSLNVSHNNILSIDRTMLADSSYIESLDLSFNSISKFHTYVSMKNSILNVSISNNHLEEISFGMFSNCTLLSSLDLGYNSIGVIEQNALQNVGKLENLKLQSNELKNIPSTLFKDTSLLSHLDLSHNQIEALFPGTFDSCRNLLILNLSHNHLKSLSYFNLYPLRNLQELNLDVNHLQDIEGIKYLKELRQISLANNPWQCKNLFNIFVTIDNSGNQVDVDDDINITSVYHVRHISCNHGDINVPILETEDETEAISQLSTTYDSVEKISGNESTMNGGSTDISTENYGHLLSTSETTHSKDSASNAFQIRGHAGEYYNLKSIFYLILVLGISNLFVLSTLVCVNVYFQMKRKGESRQLDEHQLLELKT